MCQTDTWSRTGPGTKRDLVVMFCPLSFASGKCTSALQINLSFLKKLKQDLLWTVKCFLLLDGDSYVTCYPKYLLQCKRFLWSWKIRLILMTVTINPSYPNSLSEQIAIREEKTTWGSHHQSPSRTRVVAKCRIANATAAYSPLPQQL